ncbi:MAG: DEAD/DEAH box helicase [Hyphomicrobiales bacterium]|nr:DEAD/DEAH box helicase [Hyphomicrobiales bacterium]
MSFTTLGLSQKVLAAIAAAGYKDPTPIQAQAIPPALEGRDVIGIAQTGTGKTASFVLPMLTKLEQGRARARMPRSLILEPTRELAAQVAQSFETLGAEHKLNVALIIGGVSFEDQERKLDRGADVLIATPGRLLDHFGRGKLLLTAVELLVIDEADRMLDMGFIPDIEKICKLLPPSRQTLFFSATMPPEIRKLTERFLSNPVKIEVAPPSSTAKTIVQKLKFSEPDDKIKREVLRDLMRGQNVKNAIIFCNRKRDVDIVYKSLTKHGFNVGALHGDMDQRARTLTLEGFRKGEITFLAASDVAARGLDIPEVSHVFNFDVPISPEDYVHRIGRTGRAGREGFAAMIVTPDDVEALAGIEKLINAKIDWMGGEPDPELMAARPRRKGRGAKRRGASDASVKSPRAPAERSQPRSSPGREAGATRKPAGSAPSNRPASSTEPRGHRRTPQPETAVGLGDHVPAFLRQPVRVSK